MREWKQKNLSYSYFRKRDEKLFKTRKRKKSPWRTILQELVNDGVKLGISSRGLGSVSESQGRTIVEDDFQLICFDFVSEPSTPNAFMIKEAKENKVFTKADRINRALNSILGDYEK